MKKYLNIIIILVLCLFITGCNGTITKNIRHAGYSVNGNKFICDIVMPEDEEDTNYVKIKYMFNNTMVLDDGSLFDLSMDLQYSNKQNCKRSSTEKKLVSIFDDKYFKSKDDKYYYLSANGDSKIYSEMTNKDNSYNLVNLLLKDGTNLKVVTADSSNGTYYVLKTDGNVYKYVVSKENNDKIETIISTSIVYNKRDFGGNDIVDFNYAGNSLNTYIKTRDTVYRMRITNNDKCSKYADIECNYEFKEDTIFKDYKDNIVYFNGTYLFTNYGMTFTVAE